MVGIIIQARMESQRFPGKVLMDINGKPMLERVFDRIKLAKRVEKVIIATSSSESDNSISEFAIKNNIDCYRGSQKDVLSRFYLAAKHFSISTIVRVNADCPLIDYSIIDDLIYLHFVSGSEITTNAGGIRNKRSYPIGLDVEVIDFQWIENAFNNSILSYEREHVTPYIYRFATKQKFMVNEEDQSHLRLTVDTIEDLELIRFIYENFRLAEVAKKNELVSFLNKNRFLLNINSHIIQKSHLDFEDEK